MNYHPNHIISWSELVLLYSWTLIKVNVIKNVSIHLVVIFIRMQICIQFDVATFSRQHYL